MFSQNLFPLTCSVSSVYFNYFQLCGSFKLVIVHVIINTAYIVRLCFIDRVFSDCLLGHEKCTSFKTLYISVSVFSQTNC